MAAHVGPTPVASLDGVEHTYDGNHRVLRGVELHVGAGESVAVLGRSGSGKSTLISVLALLLRPTGGQVVLDGVDTTAAGERVRARLRRERIGFVFQAANLLDDQPIWRSVALPLRIAGTPRSAIRRRSLEALEAVGLGGLERRRPRQLSGGQRQRVAVARALVTAPRLLIADEPTANLDERTGDLVANQLFERCREQGCSLVLATHDRRLAALASRRLELVDGVLEPGPPRSRFVAR